MCPACSGRCSWPARCARCVEGLLKRDAAGVGRPLPPARRRLADHAVTRLRPSKKPCCGAARRAVRRARRPACVQRCPSARISSDSRRPRRGSGGWPAGAAACTAWHRRQLRADLAEQVLDHDDLVAALLGDHCRRSVRRRALSSHSQRRSVPARTPDRCRARRWHPCRCSAACSRMPPARVRGGFRARRRSCRRRPARARCNAGAAPRRHRRGARGSRPCR